MGNEARRHRYEVVAAAMTKPEAPVFGRAPHGGAVAGNGKLLAGGHLDLDPCLATQRVLDDVRLEPALRLCRDVLPVAATAAVGNEPARGGHPLLRGAKDLDHRGLREVALLLLHLRSYLLTGKRAGDEHDAAGVVSGHPVASGHDPSDLDGDGIHCRSVGVVGSVSGRDRRSREDAGVSDRPGTDRRIQIAPSVLPANFSRMGDEVAALEDAGVDRIQWDVMDGRFVPNLTFGPELIKACRPHASVLFEAHLMVEEPDELARLYVEAGCELLIVHAEATRHLHRTLGHVRDLGAKAGVALNPGTPVAAIENVLDLVDLVLVMTVNPGFGGQDYIATMEPKIAAVRHLVLEGGHDIDIEVDGGIGPGTIQGAAAAGANVLVAGSALYRDPQGLAHAVAELRALAEAS